MVKRKAKNDFKDLSVDWRIILTWILLEMRWGSMYWIDLAQVRYRWRAVLLRIGQLLKKYLP